jgi:hypothetical protein
MQPTAEVLRLRQGQVSPTRSRVSGLGVCVYYCRTYYEKAKVSEEAVRWKGGGGGPMERRMG